jgi:cytochrome c-type biogenesis protein CcmH
MIEAMVASLDEKLKANPNDPEGWKRLVRSYVVLGRADEARNALARGRQALNEPAKAEDLTRFAASLGISVTE